MPNLRAFCEVWICLSADFASSDAPKREKLRKSYSEARAEFREFSEFLSWILSADSRMLATKSYDQLQKETALQLLPW